MTNTDPLTIADQILKGERPAGVSARSVNDSIIDFAKSRARPNESVGHAIGRLDADRDPDLRKLAMARDTMSFHEQYAQSFTKANDIVGAIEKILEDYVAQNSQSGEATPAAYARRLRPIGRR